MLSKKEFEKLWFLYKIEGASKNVAIEDFCISARAKELNLVYLRNG